MTDKKDSAILPEFKKFVSESELEEKKRKRQEEWERVRQPHQPLEAPPEEPEDTRSLFERLQEQKNLKQAEYDEKHLLKNQVKGLDDDEADFLDEVSRRQEELLKEKEEEEEIVMAEYRNSLVSQTVDKTTLKESVSKNTKAAAPQSKKPTQSQLLAGVIKRKRSAENSDSIETKQCKVERTESNNNANTTDNSNACDSKTDKSAASLDGNNGTIKVVGILPGIGGVYSDHSESSSDSSDIDTDVFRKATKTSSSDCSR